MPDGADLRTIAPTGPVTTPVLAQPHITEAAYDPAKDREATRGGIAMALVWTLVGVVLGAMVIGVATAVACSVKDACTAETANLNAIKVVIESVLTPLIGLVGAVTGFYFGEKSGKSPS